MISLPVSPRLPESSLYVLNPVYTLKTRPLFSGQPPSEVGWLVDRNSMQKCSKVAKSICLGCFCLENSILGCLPVWGSWILKFFTSHIVNVAMYVVSWKQKKRGFCGMQSVPSMKTYTSSFGIDIVARLLNEYIGFRLSTLAHYRIQDT